MEIIALGVGVMLGLLFATVMLKAKSVGYLRIDTSDPSDQPYLFLELSKGVDLLYRRKYVVLKVSNKNFIPHK